MDIIYFVVAAICLGSALCEHQTSKCHGNNYMNSMCNDSDVIAIKHLQYGAKKYINQDCPSQIIEASHNATCCSFENDDCLEEITDYTNRYLYFSRMSGLSSISQNTATPWTQLKDKCGNRTHSNYVRATFDCIKKSEIKNFCSYQKLTSANGSLYLHRKPNSDIPDTCECFIKFPENSTISVYAVDLRLQPRHPVDQNHTGECANSTYNLTFSGGNSARSYECENNTILSEPAQLYSSVGNVINISYTEGETDEAQSVWLLVKVSNGEFQIECNPRLSTTTSTTTTSTTISQSTMSGGQGNKATTKNKTFPPGEKTKSLGKKNPGPDIHQSGPSARARERAVQNTVIYAVIGISIIAAILIITAGVFIRRVRRSGKQQRVYRKVEEKKQSSDENPSTYRLEKLARGKSTSMYPGSSDHLY